MNEQEKRQAALEYLADGEGFSVDELLEAVGLEASVPAICTNPDCYNVLLLEPDFEDPCPECGQVMASALRLADVI